MDVAVITGASMGLGEEFARQLAARKVPLYLTARSLEKLDTIAADLGARHGVTVHTFRRDLAEPGAAARVVADLQARDLRPLWLVNNAGFGDAGEFRSMPPERVTGTMMVNVVALVELTRLLVPVMLKMRGARIINVASTAAFQPVPYFATYAATKAFVLSFSEGLHEELAPLGIRVLALCPGPTATQFGSQNSGLDPALFEKGQSAHYVVRRGLDASDRGEALCVTQRVAAIVAQRAVPRFLVRKTAAAIARRMMKPPK